MFASPFGGHESDGADFVTLREARDDEAAAIARVIGAAFAQAPEQGRVEQRIVDALRADGRLAISLVADRDKRVIGHVAFSPVTIGGDAAGWFGLGPLAVLPDCRRQSVGAGLVRTGIDALRRLGARGCVVLGDPAYYARFGFESTDRMTFPGAPAGCLMALAFDDAETAPAGEVRYHDAFYV